MDAHIGPLDVRDAVTWMTARWPSAHRDWANWESFVADFEPYTVGSLKETLHAWHKRGEKSAPNSSQLLRAVAETHARRVERGTDKVDRSCDSGHVWADPWPLDVDRHRYCVLCGQVGSEVRCKHVPAPDGGCTYCPEGRTA